ncbi:Heterokaryon incompatibility protein (HET) domain containing protein [Naviculisporaceae sp. PSN 640]
METAYYSGISDLPGGPHIRLLYLQPAIDQDAPIEARLEVVHLHNELRPFEALSYVWGHEVESGALRLHLQPHISGPTATAQVDITTNLAVALRHLRHLDRARILWVDAVCINQQDVAEKTAQVGIMNQIYSRAQRVLIWMGPARDRSDWVFAHINRVYHDELAARDEHENHPQAVQSEPYTAPAILAQPETFAFAQLLNREWYTRVWIIQELCVAKDALVICGDSSTPWEAIRLAFRTLDGAAHAGQPSSLLNFGISRHLALDRLRQKTAAGKLLGLDEALIRTRWSRATCPLDKVYALLGISTGDTEIVPEYSLSPESCFENATRSILLRSTITDLLDFVVSPTSVRRNPGLPSWVPDWSPEGVTAQIEVAQTLFDGYHLERMLQASDNSNPHDPPIGVFCPRFENSSPSTLITRGIDLARITAVTGPIPGPWLGNAYTTEVQVHPPQAKEGPTTFSEQLVFLKDNCNYFLHNLKHLARVVGKLVDYTPTMAAFLELVTFSRNIPLALSRLLTSNARALSTVIPSEDAKRAADHILDPVFSMISSPWSLRIYRGFYLHRVLPSGIYHGLIWLTGMFGVFVKKDPTYVQAIGALSILTPWIGMRVACLERGDGTTVLCMVPHTTAKWDSLVLIAGGRHPYVVRPRPQKEDLMLIGPCYLSIEDMVKVRQLWDGRGGRELRIS